MKSTSSGFTLFEITIVIGIVAILGTASVLALNPAQMFKQARDTGRISDLQSMNNALSYYQIARGSSFGSHNVIYISLPDTSPTCGNLFLPTPPVNWSYSCKPVGSYRNVNGTGWIPVDFTSTQGTVGTLFSALPIDPINTPLGDYYYTYIFGSWTLSATMESAKYLASSAVGDGGALATRFEVGSDLFLNSNIAVGGGLSSAKAITAFSFASPFATGVVTEGSHTIAITVPYGTAVTALVPTIAVSAGASVSPLSGTAQNFTSPVTYTVTAENGTTQAYIATVTVAAPLSSAKAITAFSFASPSATGVVNEGAHTIAITVPYGTAVTALVPTITVSAGASVSPLSGVAQNFTSPVTYTVTAQNGTTQAYVVTVTVAAAPIFAATGGTITNSGGYTIHTFTTSGTFTVTSGSGNVEVLVVAGGGGGGSGTYHGAGGGAGGLIYNSAYAVTTQAYGVTVGNGGAGGVGSSVKGLNGANSVFGSLTAIGGGGGADYTPAIDGLSGGSGGGSTYAGIVGAGTAGQGNSGGLGSASAPYGSGGGGGAGAVGGNSTASAGGAGGVGLQYSISGASTYYAGGGGGSVCAYSACPAGTVGGVGGLGGGGAGSRGNGISGTANTGGGGGGGERNGTTGGSGGSGIVIVRYLTP